MPLIEMQFFLNKSHNQISFDLVDLRRSWSPFRRYSIAPFRLALYPHTLTYRTRTFRRTMPTAFCRTTSAHFVAPNPHISSHRTRTFRRIVPRGTVTTRSSVTKRGLVAKRDTVCKRSGSVEKCGSVAKQR